MTKKLLLPTQPERRQVRQALLDRSPSISSHKQVALAGSNHRNSPMSLKHVSEHNSSCERSENSERLRRWIEEQQNLEVAWRSVPKEDEEEQKNETPPPIPPRPKALLDRLHHIHQQQQQQQQQAATSMDLKNDGNVTYPTLPPSPPLTEHRDQALLSTTKPAPPRDCTILSEVPFSTPPPPVASLSHHQAQSEPPSVPGTPSQPLPSTSNPQPLPHPSSLRTFTDTSGKFQVHAHFLDFTHGCVSLHKVNGVKIAIPLSKLSGGDIWWVFEEMERRRRGPPVVSPPAEMNTDEREHGQRAGVDWSGKPLEEWPGEVCSPGSAAVVGGVGDRMGEASDAIELVVRKGCVEV